MKFKLFISGPIPPKKNSKQIAYNKKQNRYFIVSSSNHRSWHDMAYYEVLEQKPPKGIKKCKITYQFFTSSKRRKDASNLIESVNDLLVDTGVLEDDNWFVIEEMRVLPVSYEKDGKEGVEVEIDVI